MEVLNAVSTLIVGWYARDANTSARPLLWVECTCTADHATTVQTWKLTNSLGLRTFSQYREREKCNEMKVFVLTLHATTCVIKSEEN